MPIYTTIFVVYLGHVFAANTVFTNTTITTYDNNIRMYLVSWIYTLFYSVTKINRICYVTNFFFCHKFWSHFILLLKIINFVSLYKQIYIYIDGIVLSGVFILLLRVTEFVIPWKKNLMLENFFFFKCF